MKNTATVQKENHMSLEYTHKPNYFFFAQLFIRFIENHIKQHPNENETQFSLNEVFKIFHQDLASTTTNLDAILNISDEYTVETLEGDLKLIQSYHINAHDHSVLICYTPAAQQALLDGKQLIHPDATSYQ